MNGVRRTPLPMPGVVLGPYPQRTTDRAQEPMLAGLHALLDMLPGHQGWRQKQLAAAADRVQTFMNPLLALGELALQAQLYAVRAELARDGLGGSAAEHCLALVLAYLRLSGGPSLRPNQIMAALAVLRGLLAEVPTGEGKTLATSAAACVAGLAGIPVHVVTSNDYLASRDAGLLQPLAHRLGLSVDALAAGMTPQARRRAYACSIAFCSAKELVFDYLRDSLQPPPQSLTENPLQGRVLRGLCMAIIDEADSVLIDEASTPFILSETYTEPEQVAACTLALRCAATLRAGFDYRLDARSGSVELSEPAHQEIARHTSPAGEAGALWALPRYRNEMVELAIRALHLLRRDEHYLVREGKVHIIDNHSGRIASGRAWSRGLHQMVELKERCAPTPGTRVLAQITFQQFFPRYLHLGGMSGTLVEARHELRDSYGLRVLPIPTGRPAGLRVHPPQVFSRAAARWAAVIAEIARHRAAGLPVLVGTDSVHESERLSTLLDQAGLPHRVLNARQDQEEAQLVSTAGEPGCITVTTNMAGRGTDIVISPEVAHAGGLQVVSCQHNSARRIDRQLFGRAGRLGQPGAATTMLSLEEGLLARYLSPGMRHLLGGFSSPSGRLPLALGTSLMRITQWLEERRATAARRALRERERQQRSRPAFGTRPE